MNIIRIITSILFSLIATAIMSYISMATPIGPWIEPTLALMGIVLFALIRYKPSSPSYSDSLGLATAAGGIGGIMATACAFSFPTLYFVAPELFNSWLATPYYFAFMVTSLCFVASCLGFVVADLFEHQLIVKQELTFPVGELIYKMLWGADQLRKAISLSIGFISTQMFLFWQMCTNFLSGQLALVPKLSYGLITIPKIVITLEDFPMYCAIGFIAGHIIAIPLIVGFLVKIGCIDPLYTLYPSICTFFSLASDCKTISAQDFSVAFCSGIVLYGAIKGMFELPKFLRNIFNKLYSNVSNKNKESKINLSFSPLFYVRSLFLLALMVVFLSFFNFSWLSQLYIIGFSGVCIYQVIVIAGQMGIAPLGRFATFVMVPGMFLFKLSAVQATILSAFVEISCGVAADVMFGRKMATLANISKKKITIYQWLGVIVSALSIGIIFWLLIKSFGLGYEAGGLSVNKAISRALLINIEKFDLVVMFMGFVLGYLLTFIKVNPVLVLGGILMRYDISLMLIFGGLLTYLPKNKEDYYPMWSGVFASNSIWMIVKAFVNACK